MRSLSTAAVLFFTFFTHNSYSDFVGLNIGSSFWKPDVSGTFNSSNSSDNINLANDLNLSDHSGQALTLSFEHPIPSLPNIKIQNYSLSTSSSANLSSSVSFNNQTFSGSVSSTLDLSHNDIVFYYELLDNWVNLDLGLNLKVFEGEISLQDSSIDINETIPLMYLSARFDLPFSGFYVGANIQNISLENSSSVEDSTLLIGYESSNGIGIEGGYKTFSLDLDDSNRLNTTLEYDGLYLNGYIHF